MKLVLAMVLAFLFAGALVQRVDRWVVTGLLAVISAIILITYLRF